MSGSTPIGDEVEEMLRGAFQNDLDDIRRRRIVLTELACRYHDTVHFVLSLIDCRDIDVSSTNPDPKERYELRITSPTINYEQQYGCGDLNRVVDMHNMTREYLLTVWPSLIARPVSIEEEQKRMRQVWDPK